MTYDEVLSAVVVLLQQEGRIAYRGLKRRFDIDDEYVEDLKAELIDAKRIAADEGGKVLVWIGTDAEGEKGKWGKGENGNPEGEKGKWGKGEKEGDPEPRTPYSERSAAERRQLTVLFCDLVGSTALSSQLDPEDYRAVVQRYQQTCAEVIQRHEGYLAQYLGDGLLVYFGYPVAHEDDARRAVRAGLEIVAALQYLSARHEVPSPFQREGQGEGSALARSNSPPPNPPSTVLRTGLPTGARELQVRIGLHTGLVVIGDIGASGRTEQLALGETPNIAARIQNLAEPNTVLVSAATQRLIDGQFESQPFGSHLLKGIDTPLAVYHVQSERQSTSPLAWRTTLTPLVGREEELALLHRRWEQVKDREGQVALLSGEPGIGKSRLVRELRDRVAQDGAVCLEFRCSPYHQNSALQPVIEHLHRVLHWQKDDALHTKTAKLSTTLARYRFPQADTLALFAVLLSLPQPTDTPPLTLSPLRQKQKTEEALIAWLIEEADRAPLYCAWEDLHWADPSTLELLGLLIDQTPTNRLLVLLTGRPEFTPPWGQHAHVSQLTLSRLGRRQVPQMIAQATGGKTLPTEVLQQIVAKTDGVPLFVEELTKMVVESGLLTETNGHYELSRPLPPLAIPSTLQDSLMARLDRLASVRELAQLGATIGREFAYDVLHAVSPLDPQTLQSGLRQLVATELVYQRGTPPHASYLFKHALIQDTAYQSLLKSRRQQLHRQIAQVLEERFPETKDLQPELLAHHYTEAGLIEQAIPYWQRAGQRAVERSANVEAISHLSKALEVLKTLPDTDEHAQQELALQTTIGPAWMAVKGYAAPEVEQAYSRARALCQQMGETRQLFTVLRGLWVFYIVRAELQTARELGEHLLQLAQTAQDPALLLEAHYTLGETLYYLAEFPSAYEHLEQAIALYDPQQHRSHAFLYGVDPGMFCLSRTAYVLWLLGYPDQAVKRSQEVLVLAQELAHLNTLAGILGFTSWLYQLCREEQRAKKQVEAVITLSTEQGLPFWLAAGESCRGWLLAEQGQAEEGIAQIRQGLTAYRATGAGVHWCIQPLIALTEVCLKEGRTEEGLGALAEAMDFMNSHEERWLEAELYRLKGQLMLQQFTVHSSKFTVSDPRPLIPDPQNEAEACFFKAIEIARKQQAKSLELRAVMSLVRLRQHQASEHATRTTHHEACARLAEAHQVLSEIYNWFTEGFDTKDLKEAKALLEELYRV